VYLELPEFDLEDQNLLNQANMLFSPSNYIQEKFYNDAFLTIELVRTGINQWSVNGDLQTTSSLQGKQVIEFFQNAIHDFLDDFLEVKPLESGISGERVMVSIQGLENFQDFQSVESELDKIFAIQSRSFHAFERTKIDYITQLFQTKDSLMKELRGSTKFLIKEFNADTNQLKLEYLN
jgi:DNA-directed RNA polymerase alpha subunit